MDYKLINNDCLKVMDAMIKKGVKVDAVICDPPYGVTNNGKDIQIDINYMFNLLEQFNCPIILFGQDTVKNKFASKLKIHCDYYKYSWFWDKGLATGFLNAKKQPLRSVEEIMVFYKKQCTYNPQMTDGKPNHSKGTKHTTKNHTNNNYGEFKSLESVITNKKYPKQLISIAKPHPSISVHPTQKPIDLMEYLVKTYTNVGDVVLDFTMGSGSTGVACINTGRKFIGIELDKGHFNTAKNRIEEAANGH